MKTKAGAILSSIRIDRSVDQKISVQLYMGLRDVILGGGLSGRLPASRTLATEVGVSRTTVIEAVGRLVSEGLVESRVGAGTYVSSTIGQRVDIARKKTEPKKGKRPKLAHSAKRAARQFVHRDQLPRKSQSFITALPALDSFPMAQWARLSARHWRGDRDAVMGYGYPQGLPRLRAAIATHLNATRGINCEPEQLFIVAGAQHAFSLIAGTLLNRGEKVWFENPGAIGARNALVARGANLAAVQVDADGLDVEDGLRKAPNFRLAFVTPSHQQPLGRIMSLKRRLALLQAAEGADALIVEDDYDGDFYYGNQPLPTLKSIDTANRVIYVGTFSKTLFPSLRLGFFVAPPNLVDTFSRIFASELSGTPTWPQAVVADFMDEGHFATHVRAMRALYRQRHDVLHEEASRLAGLLNIEKASAGFHTIGRLEDGLSEKRVVAAAAQAGLILSPISRYCLSPIAEKGLVIGYGSTDASQIRQGMTVLRRVLRG
jgi:GntR family transcriptional regulator/MocR family aminotransferase